MTGPEHLAGRTTRPGAEAAASLTPAGAWAELSDSQEPAAFMEAWYRDPAMRQDEDAIARHAALTARASVCSFCGVGCPYTVMPGANGRDKLQPLSHLGLCIKGATSLLTGGDTQRVGRLERHGVADDRIRAPMIRGHDGALVEVTWEQALDRAAWLFLHTREWVGFQAPAIYGNGQKTLETIWLACLYKLVFRLPTIGANSEHCLASAGAAHEQSFGNEASFTWQAFDELERCDVAILHGTNPYVTFPQAYYKLKRNKDAIKVVIDPVENDTVLDLKATDPEHTLHIRFEQGGDVLFNLAVARVILEEGWHDAEFLARAVDPASVEAFRALVFEDRCHPDVVAREICLSGDDPADLAQTLRRYAALIAAPLPNGERPRPAFVSSMGINQSTGSYGFSTNLNLLLLTGNVGREGAGSLRIAGQSNATSELMMGLNSRRLAFNLDPKNDAHRRQLAEALGLPIDNIPDSEGTPVSHMADDDYLYCFLFVGTQMTRNMPRLGHWTRRLGRAFNVVIDPFLVEGALDHADVVLPSLTYTERLGVIQRGDRTLQLQQPVTRAPEKAWSDEKILVHLALTIARRLRDPDTAALNRLDPEVVDRAFRRYLKADGDVDVAAIFDHVVELSETLGVYSRLHDAQGRRISHATLKANAGQGVQWQGNGRYTSARKDGAVFPRLREGERGLARLVRPPERFLAHLVDRGEERIRSLISGRGRPGRDGRHYRARYNSGVKTLALTGREAEGYFIELHPAWAAREGLEDGQLVRVTSHHGTVVGVVSYNEHVPEEHPFVDFVPGQINRLTNYIDSDGFTNQSLIKRTPIRIEPLSAVETALWRSPDPAAFDAAVRQVHALYRAAYPTDAPWEDYMRGDEGAVDWLPLGEMLRPAGAVSASDVQAISALAAFVQRYQSDRTYKEAAASLLHGLDAEARDRLLACLLPLLRKLDLHLALVDLLSDVVGPLLMSDAEGKVSAATVKGAHQCAVLELKEEVVAVQLFIAIKRGVEKLYGEGAVVPREDLAFVSGIAIPCAGDVPAYAMGIAPSELGSGRLLHCRSIGVYGLMVIDRRNERAVLVNIDTGVLPRDKELMKLRSRVIMKKQAATRQDHRRFFDRLGELMSIYVRLGDGNFTFYGPVHLPWAEFQEKLTFVPAQRKEFLAHLRDVAPTPALVRGMVALGMLDADREGPLIAELLEGCPAEGAAPTMASALGRLLADTTVPAGEKVAEVIRQFVAPVLDNDGGKIDLLGFDEAEGEVTVRFVGSCANCPYSMLSMETLVKPALLNVPGVVKVTHRGRLRTSDDRLTCDSPTTARAPRVSGAAQPVSEAQ